jgi:hypothetical protein
LPFGVGDVVVHAVTVVLDLKHDMTVVACSRIVAL